MQNGQCLAWRTRSHRSNQEDACSTNLVGQRQRSLVIQALQKPVIEEVIISSPTNDLNKISK